MSQIGQTHFKNLQAARISSDWYIIVHIIQIKICKDERQVNMNTA